MVQGISLVSTAGIHIEEQSRKEKFRFLADEDSLWVVMDTQGVKGIWKFSNNTYKEFSSFLTLAFALSCPGITLQSVLGNRAVFAVQKDGQQYTIFDGHKVSGHSTFSIMLDSIIKEEDQRGTVKIFRPSSHTLQWMNGTRPLRQLPGKFHTLSSAGQVQRLTTNSQDQACSTSQHLSRPLEMHVESSHTTVLIPRL